jgi:hypothetical protein
MCLKNAGRSPSPLVKEKGQVDADLNLNLFDFTRSMHYTFHIQKQAKNVSGLN